MKKRLWGQCAVLSLLLSMPFTAFGQKVNTLSNAQLFSQQYARVDTTDYLTQLNVVKYDYLSRMMVSRKKLLMQNNDSLYFPYSKCVVYGFLGEVIGGGVGLVIGVIVPDSRKEGDGSGGFGGLRITVRNGLIGAGVGATIGCAIGVHNGGKKYRNKMFIPALAGAVLTPACVAAYLNYNDKTVTTETILLASVVTPILSTAMGCLFTRKTK